MANVVGVGWYVSVAKKYEIILNCCKKSQKSTPNNMKSTKKLLKSTNKLMKSTPKHIKSIKKLMKSTNKTLT